ncbi:cupredoxin domain-containing protein [Candidatus Uhrbacteria bacterium]|nr:cupredoxin domain-containing protein [Candidatus Uhrbacteria bacterium]
MTKRLSLISILATAIALATLVAFATFTRPASAATLVTPEALQAGDLIRGQSYAAVYYYGTDGFRYVFPNDKTYFTWYKNFDTVKWLSDDDLSTIQIGGNVTYKPGIKMIKINSDPKVYAVGASGTIRAVTSEAIASGLYGNDWNKKIDDMPDGFFSNYKMGKSVEAVSGFSVTGEMADATDINTDKGLKAATKITISASGFSPSSVTIQAKTAVRFVNMDSVKHSASSDNGTWGTGTLPAGKHFSRYFKEAGTFTYHDAYGNYLGTIIVQ